MNYSLTYYKDPGLLTDAVKMISIDLNDHTYLTSFFLSYQPTDKKELNHINSAVSNSSEYLYYPSYLSTYHKNL